MPDQKLAAPYGDIVFVNTPNLDRMGAMIYNEEKQRKAAQAKADADLDNEFSKNIAGIHNADIPDLTKAWGDFKAARQSLIATKGGTTPEQQMAALQAKAKVYDLISKSKLRKQTDLETLADYRKNPLNYNEDAHSQFLADLGKPTSKLPQDYYNNYRYNGNTVDFSKVLDAAKGKIISGQQETITTKGGLETQVYDVKRFNNPTEYFHTVVDKVIGDKATNQFIRKYNVPQEQYNQVKDQYDLLISDPKIKSRFELQVDLPQESDLTPLTRAAKFLAMQYAIQNPPTTTLKPSIKNTKAIIDYKHGQKVGDIYLQDRLIRARAKYTKAATDNGITINDVYDKLVQNQDAADINTTDEKGNKVKAARFNALPNDAQNIVMASLKEINPDVAFDNVYQISEPDGSIGIYITDENDQPKPSIKTRLTTISRTGINLKAQPNVKGKVEVIKQGEKNKPTGTNGWKSRAKKIK